MSLSVLAFLGKAGSAGGRKWWFISGRKISPFSVPFYLTVGAINRHTNCLSLCWRYFVIILETPDAYQHILLRLGINCSFGWCLGSFIGIYHIPFSVSRRTSKLSNFFLSYPSPPLLCNPYTWKTVTTINSLPVFYMNGWRPHGICLICPFLLENSSLSFHPKKLCPFVISPVFL